MSEKENKENQVKETAGTKKEEKVIKEVKKETIKEPEAVEVKKENKTGKKYNWKCTKTGKWDVIRIYG